MGVKIVPDAVVGRCDVLDGQSNEE